MSMRLFLSNFSVFLILLLHPFSIYACEVVRNINYFSSKNADLLFQYSSDQIFLSPHSNSKYEYIYTPPMPFLYYVSSIISHHIAVSSSDVISIKSHNENWSILYSWIFADNCFASRSIFSFPKIHSYKIPTNDIFRIGPLLYGPSNFLIDENSSYIIITTD